jgi:hypothetical protein
VKTIDNSVLEETGRDIQILGVGQFSEYCVLFGKDRNNPPIVLPEEESTETENAETESNELEEETETEETTTSNNSNINIGNDFIFLMSTEIVEGVEQVNVRKIYQGDLGFQLDHPIKTVCVYENEKIQKVYWIDGINTPKVINVAKHLLVSSNTDDLKSVSEQKIDFTPALTFNETVKITRTSGGQFPAGVIQYALTYSDKNLQESNIWYVSPLYYITNVNTGGSAADTKCNIAFTLDFSKTIVEIVEENGVPTEISRVVTTLDNSFNFLQVYAIVRTSLQATPTCYRIADIPTTTLQFTDSGSLWESYPIEDLIQKQRATFIPKTLASKDGTLFMGNFTISSEQIDRNDPNFNVASGTEETINFFDALANNTTTHFKQIHDYFDNALDVKTFRSGEYYRIGIQFQDKFGSPSNTIYLKDIQAEVGEPSTGKFMQKIIKSVLPIIPEKLSNKYVRARLMMVDRTSLPHRTICQGVLCPTVYRVTDRVSNLPFAMSSWCMRGFNAGNTAAPIWEPDKPLWSNHNISGGEIENQLKQIGVQINQQTHMIEGDDADNPTASPDIMFNTESQEEFSEYYGIVVRIFQDGNGLTDSILDIYCKKSDTLTDGHLYTYPTPPGTKLFKIQRTLSQIKALGYNIYGEGFDHVTGGAEALKSYVRDALTTALHDNNVLYTDTIVDNTMQNWRYNDEDCVTIVVTHLSPISNPTERFMAEHVVGSGVSLSPYGPSQNVSQALVTITVSPLIPEKAQQLALAVGQPFFCDHSILTFHSPDVEKYQEIIDKNPNLKYRVVGFTNINESYFSSHLQTTAPETTGSNNGIRPTIKLSQAGIYNANLWQDDLLYPIYIWHRSMTLGGQADADPEADGKWYGQYTKKILANVHHCNNSYSFLRKVTIQGREQIKTYEFYPIEDFDDAHLPTGEDGANVIYGMSALFTEMGTPRVFNFDEVTALTIDKPKHSSNRDSKLIYYGNVNMYHSNKSYSVPIIKNGKIIDKDKSLISDPCLMRYKSSPHVVMPMSYMRIREQLTEDGIFAYAPSLPYPIFEAKYSGKASQHCYLWENKVHGLMRNALGHTHLADLQETFSPEGLLYIAELYQDLTIDNIYGDTTEINLSKYSWIPISTWINLQEGEEMQGYGDCFIGRWECLKTFAYAEDDIQSYIDVTSFIIESDTNLESRYDNYKGTREAATVNQANFNLYNTVYDQQDNLFNYRVLSKGEYVDNFQNQICWSEVKTLGESLDTWCQLNVGNTTDLQGEYGELRALQVCNNSLYCWQDNAVYKLNYNTRVTISPSDGVPILLTNNYKVEPPLLLKSTCGVKSSEHIVSTTDKIYFLDWTRKRIFILDEADKINDLSSNKGMTSLLLKLGAPKKLFFDSYIKDVYFNFESGTLAYNEDIQEFTSLYDYINMEYIIPLNDSTYTTYANKIYKQRSGKYNHFFGEYKPYYIELLANNDALKSKTFTNVEFTMDSTALEQGASTLNKEVAFNQINAQTSYQEGQEALSFNRYLPSNLKRKFRLWRVNIPRDYTRKLDRMRDTWCRIKLTKNPVLTNDVALDTNNNVKTRVNNINISYLPD